MEKENQNVLTEKERQAELEKAKAQLKILIDRIAELEGRTHNDWHSWFHALLNMKLYRFFDRISIKPEFVLGVEPPRADFLILTEDEVLDLGLDVFKIFRKHNIIEFKNPTDTLDRRVLCKVVGYGNIYISQAKHKDDIPVDQVTLSIFRESHPSELFKELGDKVKPDKTKGIYHVTELTELPLQIVVTKELIGEEYAEFRGISEKPDKADIIKIIEDAKDQKEYFMQQQYRAYLDMAAKIDRNLIDEIRRDKDMTNAWMDIFKSEIDQRIDEHDAQRDLDRGCRYVRDGQMTVEYAAGNLNITPAEFIAEMEKRGYKIPQKEMAGV